MRRHIPQDLRVGCCGFPINLAHYAGEFGVVEVQHTFYQPPLARTLEKWRSQVPEEFEFTLKAWQLITHEGSSPTYRRLREKLSEKQKREAGAFRVNATVMAAWERTLEAAHSLRSRAILFQCPARFAPTTENKSNLRAIIGGIRHKPGTPNLVKNLTLVWEPRGEWKAEEVRELCEELQLVHGIDPLAQQAATQGLGYFRLHGRSGYRYRYTDDDLKQLLELARQRTPCYVLFNNISMLEDARRFRKLVAGT